jgi:hypothetical protein
MAAKDKLGFLPYREALGCIRKGFLYARLGEVSFIFRTGGPFVRKAEDAIYVRGTSI